MAAFACLAVRLHMDGAFGCPGIEKDNSHFCPWDMVEVMACIWGINLGIVDPCPI